MHIRNTFLSTTNAEAPDLIAKLCQEYKILVDTLEKQGTRKDPVLLMRLGIVMMDLGFYQPSPP